MIFLYYFDVYTSKIFLKKNIILMCFKIKNTLKNNRYHIFKHTFSITQNEVKNFFHFSSDDLGSDIHLNRNLHLERISKT